MAGLSLILTGLAALVATFLYLIEIHTFPIVEDEVQQ